MAAAGSAPGAFIGLLGDEAHSDSVIPNDTAEFYIDDTNDTLAARVNHNGGYFTVGLVPTTGSTVVTASATELNVLDGVTAGTATASKAVVLDGSKGIATITSATITTLTAPTVNATNVDAGASGTAGTVDIFPSTASKGKASISVTDQTTDATVSLVVGAMAGATTVTLRDPGAAASILTTTDGTAAATTATAVEITRAADVSARLVAAGGTLAVTLAAHEGRIVQLDTAAGSVCTLPAASGTGAKFTFVITTIATSNSHIVKVANASDTMYGVILAESDDAADVAKAFIGSGTDDTITLNRTTTGSVALGEWIECVDIATNKWWVRGVIAANGAEATPFSATV